MKYEYKITGQESEEFWSLINRIEGEDCHKVTRFPRIPIGAIRVVNKSCERFAGDGEQDFYKPYLADKDDLIAFDKKTPMKITYKYSFEVDGTEGGSTKTLIIGLRWFSSDWVIYPIAAALMYAANDIDVSDDNFRQWLINNRPIAKPKVNKMEMTEDGMKNELFKFLQLKEHADKVKITQEMGQQLFNLLVDRAEAIAHEEMSGDALATDSDKFVLELVNNLINSAKPAPAKPFAIQPMESDERNQFMRLSFEYEQRCRLPMLSGQVSFVWLGHSVPQLQTVIRKLFGEPVKTQTNVIYFLFKVHDIACRVVLDGYSIILDVHRESGRRDEIVRAIRAAIEDAYKKEQENG